MARVQTIEIVGFLFCFIVSISLVVLSIYNLWRQHNSITDCTENNFQYTRWLVIVISILQLIVFLGYFLQSEILMQLGWTLWIPLAVLSLSVLSIRMISTYMNIINLSSVKVLKDKSNFNKISITSYLFVIIIAGLDFSGTILGSILNNIRYQTLCYSLWKLVGFITLSSINILTFLVWYQCKLKYPFTPKHTKAHKNIKYAIIKLGILFVFILILSLTILIQGIQEIISFAHNYHYDYVEEPMWRLIFIYLFIWSSITIINLSYSWIPSYKLKKYIKTTDNASSTPYTDNNTEDNDEIKSRVTITQIEVKKESNIKRDRTGSTMRTASIRISDHSDDSEGIALETDNIENKQESSDEELNFLRASSHKL